MPNAEIAVRLGVSVNTVRYHVSNLLTKAGASSREDLARWNPKTEGRGRSSGWLSPGLKPAALGVAAIAAVAIGIFLLVPVLKGQEPEVILPEPFIRPDPDELRAEGFIDAGKLMETELDGDPVLGHSPRSLFTPVLLAGEGSFVEVEGDAITASFGDEQSGYVDKTRRLETSAGPFIVHAQNWPTVSPDGSDRRLELGILRPVVFVWASNHDNSVLYRATLTPDGHAWINPDPVPSSAAYDAWTGEQLDLGRARHVGTLDPALAHFLFTGCDDGLCYISFSAALPLQSPAPGMLSCESDSVLLLETDGARLQFAFTAMSRDSELESSFDCGPRAVSFGDDFGPEHHYLITAFDDNGAPLSIAITLDGELYVGDIAPTVQCPCRQGV